MYNNHLGAGDMFALFWRTLAKHFASNPYVMGFDPLNEPTISLKGILNVGISILGGSADKDTIQLLFSKVQSHFDEVSPKSIMLFENVIFPDVMGAEIGPERLDVIRNIGYTKPPGAHQGSARHAMNAHTYCCQLNEQVCDESGEVRMEYANDCWDYHYRRLTTREHDAIRLGIPLIVTEFGSCMNTEGCAAEIKAITDIAEMHVAGFAYWQFKNFHDSSSQSQGLPEGYFDLDGTIHTKKVKALTRTYIMNAQGRIIRNKLEHDTGKFVAVIQIDTTIDAPSILYAKVVGKGEQWYPNGYTIRFFLKGEEITDSGKIQLMDAELKHPNR